MALKVYTQEEADADKPDKNGKRYFPTGDYSAIKDFGPACVFSSFAFLESIPALMCFAFLV